jgi:hypothetical protein
MKAKTKLGGTAIIDLLHRARKRYARSAVQRQALFEARRSIFKKLLLRYSDTKPSQH